MRAASQPSDAEAESLNVSRETLDALMVFADLLIKWTKRVNLIAKASTNELWSRHILNSAQLFPLAPHPARVWLDLGSGGGLPGLVCAILARERAPETRFVLVESDGRKAAFLTQAIAEVGLNATVLNRRIEGDRLPTPDIVTARALAPLDRLLALIEPHVNAESCLLFPKGARFADEIEVAQARWRFSVDIFPSITSSDGRILRCSLIGRH